MNFFKLVVLSFGFILFSFFDGNSQVLDINVNTITDKMMETGNIRNVNRLKIYQINLDFATKVRALGDRGGVAKLIWNRDYGILLIERKDALRSVLSLIEFRQLFNNQNGRS